MTESKMIKVDYSYIDGAHFFSGRDPMALGLCVAHKDLKTAFDEALSALKYLLGKNHNIQNAVVESVIPFEEFSKWVAKVQEAPPKMKAKKSAVSELPFMLEAAA